MELPNTEKRIEFDRDGRIIEMCGRAKGRTCGECGYLREVISRKDSQRTLSNWEEKRNIKPTTEACGYFKEVGNCSEIRWHVFDTENNEINYICSNRQRETDKNAGMGMNNNIGVELSDIEFKTIADKIYTHLLLPMKKNPDTTAIPLSFWREVMDTIMTIIDKRVVAQKENSNKKIDCLFEYLKNSFMDFKNHTEAYEQNPLLVDEFVLNTINEILEIMR